MAAAVQFTAAERAVLEEALVAIRKLRYGSVQLIVQDGRVIQIDTIEKRRLDRT
jgi:hypothetical protein